MTWSLIQAVKATSGSWPRSLAFTASNVTAGNVLAVFSGITLASNTLTECQDSSSNFYNVNTPHNAVGIGFNETCVICWAIITTGGVKPTVTVNWSGGGSAGDLCIAELHQTLGTTGLAQDGSMYAADQTSSVTSVTTPVLTANYSNAVGLCYAAVGGNTTAMAGSWTGIEYGGNLDGDCTAFQGFNAGTLAPDFTTTSGAYTCIGVVLDVPTSITYVPSRMPLGA